MSTVHESSVSGPVPRPFVACTASECGPSDRPLAVTGLAHGAKAPPSMLQATVAEPSFVWNVTPKPVAEVIAAGAPASIVTTATGAWKPTAADAPRATPPSVPVTVAVPLEPVADSEAV